MKKIARGNQQASSGKRVFLEEKEAARVVPGLRNRRDRDHSTDEDDDDDDEDGGNCVLLNECEFLSPFQISETNEIKRVEEKFPSLKISRRDVRK